MLWPVPRAEHADGLPAQIARPLRRRHDHADPAVGVAAAIEQAQRLADHARALVIVERDGTAVAQRSGPLRGVGALRDRDGAQLLRGRSVEVHVALRVERVGRRRAHHAEELRVAVAEAADPRARSGTTTARSRSRAPRAWPGRSPARRAPTISAEIAVAPPEARLQREERPETQVAQVLEDDAAVARDVAVDVGAAQARVLERELERLPPQLALGDPEIATLPRDPDADDRAARRAQLGHITTWSSVYSSRPKRPFSRPMPECLKPPDGFW